MKKIIDEDDDIVFPYVKNVKPTLLWEGIERISGEEALKNMVRKLNDNVYRYHGYYVGWDNKKIHGIDEKEK
jgi:hypothetical protein